MAKKNFLSTLLSFFFCIFLLLSYCYAQTLVKSVATEEVPGVTKSATVHLSKKWPIVPPPIPSGGIPKFPPIPGVGGGEVPKFPLPWPFVLPPLPSGGVPKFPLPWPFVHPPLPSGGWPKFPNPPPLPGFKFPPIPPFAFPPLPGFKFPPLFPPFPGTPPHVGAKGGDGANKKN